MIEQISVPLSSQISLNQEQPSQEENEPSPSETAKVDNIEAKTEENQELVLDNSIVKETTSSKEVIVKDTSIEQQEDNKETENNNSVTDDNNKDQLDIESARLEISNILNNNTTNIENETDCQKTPSPSLSYVVMDPLPQLSISSQVPNKPPQRLEYDVIHATGWDENYPAHQVLPKDKNSSKEEVIQHGKGWQSQRQCTYPQEIILQVSCGAARIRKLQILSHHYKIATKLEIYIGSVQQRKEMVGMDKNTGGIHDEKKTLSWDKLKKVIDNDGINFEEDDSSEENDYDIIRENTANSEPYILFRRIGYCALDNNERANYKARELKSVRLDAEGEYIRLVARRCHENHLNQYNQVGIVGIAVMGEPADYLLAGESQKIPIEHADEGLSRVASPETCIVPFIQDINDQRNFTSLYSILPNPSLSVPNNNSPTTTTSLPNNTDDQTNKNYNPVIANDFLSNGEGTENLLAAFGRAKQNAVKVEDFNLAKVLKYCTEIVKKAAEEVQKFERLKKQAVEEEDFDNAEQYKHEIEALRAGVRGTITDEGLDLDDSGEVVVCDSSLQDIIGLADDVEVSPSYNPMNLGNVKLAVM